MSEACALQGPGACDLAGHMILQLGQGPSPSRLGQICHSTHCAPASTIREPNQIKYDLFSIDVLGKRTVV